MRLLRAAARELGAQFEPVPLRGWMSGAELIASARSIGATVRPVQPFYGWILAVRNGGPVEPISRFAPELVAADVHVNDFNGVVAIEHAGEGVLALRIDEQVFPGHLEHVLVL